MFCQPHHLLRDRKQALGTVVTITPTLSRTEFTARVQHYAQVYLDQMIPQYQAAGYGQDEESPPIPYDELNQQAATWGEQQATLEEQNRQQTEQTNVENARWTGIQNDRDAGAQFILPSNVKSIAKGGVLVVAPTGGPVERRK